LQPPTLAWPLQDGSLVASASEAAAHSTAKSPGAAWPTMQRTHTTSGHHSIRSLSRPPSRCSSAP
jgi:hypothetical protein